MFFVRSVQSSEGFLSLHNRTCESCCSDKARQVNPKNDGRNRHEVAAPCRVASREGASDGGDPSSYTENKVDQVTCCLVLLVGCSQFSRPPPVRIAKVQLRRHHGPLVLHREFVLSADADGFSILGRRRPGRSLAAADARHNDRNSRLARSWGWEDQLSGVRVELSPSPTPRVKSSKYDQEEIERSGAVSAMVLMMFDCNMIEDDG